MARCLKEWVECIFLSNSRERVVVVIIGVYTYGFRVDRMYSKVCWEHEIVLQSKTAFLSWEQENQLNDEGVDQNIHKMKSGRRNFTPIGSLLVIHLRRWEKHVQPGLTDGYERERKRKRTLCMSVKTREKREKERTKTEGISVRHHTNFWRQKEEAEGERDMRWKRDELNAKTV